MSSSFGFIEETEVQTVISKSMYWEDRPIKLKLLETGWFAVVAKYVNLKWCHSQLGWFGLIGCVPWISPLGCLLG